MCYSAKVWADYRSYVRFYGATLSVNEFVELFRLRLEGHKIAIPKAMADAFLEPTSPEEQEIKSLIDAYNEREKLRLQEDLFKQRKRLADAERQLGIKTTEKALEDQRIAGSKIELLLTKLADLDRSEPKERDSRIYPKHYCPVMVMEGGKLVVKPMRYQCRPCGKPAFYDRQYPGTYNARRDNLQKFWKGQFGKTHALVVATAFFENVSRHRMEGRELAEGEEAQNVVLRFEPADHQPMQLACLWSKWSGQDEPDLLSFAAITDEPPPEVSAAGHDRCIIPIVKENVEPWLNPSIDVTSSYRILDEREQHYYEHKLVA